MAFFLEIYRITLDFLYKISGPMIAIAVIGFIIFFRKDLANFISKNIAKISGKVAGQNFEIDFNKLKESQSEPVKITDKDLEVEKLRKELEFERIYSIIFGSQIELLKKLRKDDNLISEVMMFYINITKSYTIFEGWSFSEYLNVLTSNKLIETLVDHSNKVISVGITQKGLDFLKYIEENNYNDRLF